MSDPAAARLVERLGLLPHPEGGWYREVYRSATEVEAGGARRAALTTIHYLLERGQVSRWHVVDADEAWHFHAGEPLEVLAYAPATRELCRHVLGPGADAAAHVAVVPAGWWQAARPLGGWTLVGCTVAPGFEFSGFALVDGLDGHAAHFAAALAAYADLL